MPGIWGMNEGKWPFEKWNKREQKILENGNKKKFIQKKKSMFKIKKK